MRVLVVLEDDYRLYREMLAECLRIRRTGAEVESATPESLEEELERFDLRVIFGHALAVEETCGPVVSGSGGD